MVRHLVLPLVLIAAALLLAAPTRAQAPVDEPAGVTLPVDLQPHWKQGQTARYELWQVRTTRTAMKIGTQSQQIDTSSQIEGEMTWRVDRVRADGSADCTYTYDWLRLTLSSSAGQTQVSDSRQASGDNESVMKFLKALTGVPIEVHMAADGSALSTTSEKVIAQKGPGLPNLPDNLDLLESATDAVSLTAAPAEANLNTSWKADFDWNHEIGKLAHSMQYQLTGVEQIAGIPVATITMQAKLKLTPDASNFPDPSQAKVDVQMHKGSLSTQIMYDLDRREVVGRNSSRDMSIQINVTVNGRTLQRTIDEQLQDQMLRIAEE